MTSDRDSATPSPSYLDWASSAPLRRTARAAMIEALDYSGADPGRLHRRALEARYLVEERREQLAEALGARPSEVVFTSGATESINAVTRFAQRDGQVFSVVEHAAVRLGATGGIGRDGIDHPATHAVQVGADPHGRIDPDDLLAAAAPLVERLGDAERGRFVVAHMQWANQEVGTLQPVVELATRAASTPRLLVHTDAAMAVGRVPVAFRDSGVALMSVSSHKLGGPAGVGALVVARGTRIGRILEGGDQERARRAGVENVVGIAGFAAAAAEATTELAQWAEHTADVLEPVRRWAAAAPGVRVVGPADGDERLSDLVCLTVADIEPQALVQELDRRGVAVHSGSSCASEVLEPSPVLAAMGEDAERSLRISVGRSTTLAETTRACELIGEAIDALRQLGGR